MKNEKMIKLATDILNGSVDANFTKEQTDKALRIGFFEILGLPIDSKKIPYKVFRKHKDEIFEIIEETVQVRVHEGFTDLLEPLVEYRNLELGDTNEFYTPASQYFRVSTISDGNGNLRRQRLIDGQSYTVRTENRGLKIYEEFERFLAGRINWVEMCNIVAVSFVREIKEEIYNTVVRSFDEINAPSQYRLNVGGGKAPSQKQILTMVKHIEAKTGMKANIFGTALALSDLEIKYPDEKATNSYNEKGYFGSINGTTCIEIEALHKVNTDDFIFPDNLIIILPTTPDKMVKVVNEGQAIILEGTEANRVDMQKEYLFTQKIGISILESSVFGVIKYT